MVGVFKAQSGDNVNITLAASVPSSQRGIVHGHLHAVDGRGTARRTSHALHGVDKRFGHGRTAVALRSSRRCAQRIFQKLGARLEGISGTVVVEEGFGGSDSGDGDCSGGGDY